ncbi:translocation protein sec62, putative [Theileria equi strain WA]|uniref:Translocation protein SEC62 n=1 Tax=Theileria equi strain WA TaxID=1537102 RepID=L0AUH9_THEEQ|nr:translocation protein sec62, putative [Theileria equi strain WA]AFZ79287.1 translocation protein sec62, putative [Theileria equi strain WA]|eukprot:XP_004828953.1 translocation protein sec62, putative [Theileria equi strain WA]
MGTTREERIHKELTSFMDTILNGGIKIKSAAEVGKRAVQYTRADELLKCIVKHKETIHKTCPSYLDGTTIEDTEDVARFVDALIENGFMYRAQYHPLEGCLEKTETGSYKRPTWPKRLIKTQKQHFDSVGFYILSYEGSQKWNYFMLCAMIFGIFAMCMFQAWPLYLKLSMWYLSVVLLSFLLVAIILRLILFLALWFCGFDFWLFPNLFDEDLGVVDSFKPLYSLLYRNDNYVMIGCRMLCSILVAVSVNELRKTHDIKDIGNFAKQSFMDVLEWGHQKLTALPEDNSIYKTLGVDLDTEFTEEQPGEAGEENEDDDYSCLFACGFKSLDEFMKKCMSNCECMSDLLTNSCLNKCPEETIQSLTEVKNDACKRYKRK